MLQLGLPRDEGTGNIGAMLLACQTIDNLANPKLLLAKTWSIKEKQANHVIS